MTNLPQAEFAVRFGPRIDAVNWEESGADIEDPAALHSLRVIESEPDAVSRVFAHCNVP